MLIKSGAASPAGLNRVKARNVKHSSPLEARSLPRVWFVLWALWVVFVLGFFIARLPMDGNVWRDAFHLSRFGVEPVFDVFLRRFSELFIPLAGGLWAVALTQGAGRLSCRALGWDAGNPWSRFAWDFALGTLLLQWFWLGTGLLHLWRAPLLGTVGVVATGFLWARSRRSRSGEETGPASTEGEIGAGWEKTLFLVLAASAVGMGVLLSVLPETFYDSLAYVLAVPQQWLRSGGITDDPHQLYSGLSLGASLWYTTGLAPFGDGAARFMSITCVFAAALAVGGWARRSSGRGAGALAMMLMLSMPQFGHNGWAARSDIPMALLLFLAFDALSLAPQERGTGGASSRAAFLAGFCFGGAFSIKYVALASGAALAVWALFERDRWRPRDALWFGAGALGAAAPWLLKNLAFAGNPLYPYFPGLFGGRELPPWGLTRLVAENHLTGVDWLSWPPALWRLTQPGYAESQAVGPFAMTLIPILLLFRSRSPESRPWAVSLGVFWVAALWATPALRFHFAGLMLLALGAAWAWAALGGWARRTASLLAILISLGGLCWMAYLAMDRFDPWGAWSLRESRSDYAERATRFPYGALTRWTGECVPKDGRLLLVGDQRGFGYPCRVLWNSVDDEAYLAVSAREDGDAAALARRFRRDGITHVGFNLGEGSFTTPDYRPYRISREEWARLDANLRGCLRLIRREGGLFLYEVVPPGEPSRDVQAMEFLSPPALSARESALRGDREAAQKGWAEMKAWFPLGGASVTGGGA